LIISHTQIELGRYMLTLMFNTHAKYYKINFTIDELSAKDLRGHFLLVHPVQDKLYILQE